MVRGDDFLDTIRCYLRSSTDLFTGNGWPDLGLSRRIHKTVVLIGDEHSRATFPLTEDDLSN